MSINDDAPRPDRSGRSHELKSAAYARAALAGLATQEAMELLARPRVVTLSHNGLPNGEARPVAGAAHVAANSATAGPAHPATRPRPG